MAKLGKGMLFSVEQEFVGRDEIRASLKTPAWEVNLLLVGINSNPVPFEKKGMVTGKRAIIKEIFQKLSLANKA